MYINIMKIEDDSIQYVKMIRKLNELNHTHPNISRAWMHDISQKRNDYLLSLIQCNNMFQIVSEYKMQDMSINDILLLQTISEIMRENKI